MRPLTSLLLLLLVVAGTAQSASSVDLSISATTHPAACDIRLENGGHVDYGVLSLEIVPELPLSDMRSRDAKTHEGQLRIDVSAT